MFPHQNVNVETHRNQHIFQIRVSRLSVNLEMWVVIVIFWWYFWSRQCLSKHCFLCDSEKPEYLRKKKNGKDKWALTLQRVSTPILLVIQLNWQWIERHECRETYYLLRTKNNPLEVYYLKLWKHEFSSHLTWKLTLLEPSLARMNLHLFSFLALLMLK